ncbi:helix-turn-helix domain-containing protein [Plebeiibacterium marinum]|uniref:Helix-turn-helix domain-containing protein n=1 Tax=Plebeiibacterium marinum TaxID=2992111 RepID=A0AAE3MDU7_9BACT|nr:helix-turn-helix transcriptional regulator [Plebeiobacterium marinum]MCW3805767.1 helix-turn-helix domain-containing protein [Plebeiobacterium marinum]
MKQRLQTLLSSERISSSKFADMIGVNRSSVSHLLSGRNNPSLDILQKVLTKFPHINPDWLMLGQGNMYRNQHEKVENVHVNKELFRTEEIQTDEPPVHVKKSPDLNKAKESESTIEKSIKPSTKKSSENIIQDSEENNEKVLEKIVFFYSDYSFETYYPERKH